MKILQWLYFSEHPEEHSESLSLSAIRLKLQRARGNAIRLSRGNLRKKAPLPALQNPDSPTLKSYAATVTDIIAALGEMDMGATLEEIQQKTGIFKTQLASTLETLVQEGIANYRGDSRRYYPGTEHLDWTGQAGNRLAQAIFQSTVERLTQVAQKHFGREDTMLLSSAISVSKKDLPRLRAELREVILRFVDRSLSHPDSPSDTVVQVVGALFEGRLAPPAE
jgi:DNA-binding transcriptional regulator GbsR (MarR family)